MLDNGSGIIQVHLKHRPNSAFYKLQNSNGIIQDMKRPSSCRASQIASPLSVKIGQKDELKDTMDARRNSYCIREIELKVDQNMEKEIKRGRKSRPFSAGGKWSPAKKLLVSKNFMFGKNKLNAFDSKFLVSGYNITISMRKRNHKKNIILPSPSIYQ